MTTVPDNVKHLMKEQHIAVISTVDTECRPYAATVFVVMHDNGTIFFPTRTSSQKFRNIRAHPEVALVVNHPSECITVQIHGTASEVSDSAQTQHAIDQLMCCSANGAIKKHWLPPVKRMQDGHFTIMQIRPTWIRHSDFRDEEHPGERFVTETTL